MVTAKVNREGIGKHFSAFPMGMQLVVMRSLCHIRNGAHNLEKAYVY